MPTRRLWLLLAACALVLGVARATVAAPEMCPAPSAGEARAAALAGAHWLVANQLSDGSYRYLVSDSGEDLGGYSNVRHAGATLALYEAARAANDPELLAAADLGTAWMIERLQERDDWVALDEGGAAPLGGSALMLAALAERRIATNETRYDDTMRELGRFLLAMQRPNGDFAVFYDFGTDQRDEVQISQYYAGESLWALALLQNALADDAFRSAAVRAAQFISTERNDRDFVPVGPLNDHWAAHGFAEMADWPISDAAAKYARLLYGRFQLLIRNEAQKDSGAPYRWLHAPKRRSAALGTWVEGQASLTALARTDARVDDLRREALESTECGAGVLVARQRHSDDPRTNGAWFAHGETRMDDQQHAITGLLGLADLLEAKDRRA